MALRTTHAGEQTMFMDNNAAGATVTLTLPNPGSGLAWVLDMIAVWALGTITVFDVEVFKSDGTTKISRMGGQVSAGTLCLQQPSQCAIICVSNDGPQVVLTATGASACELTVTAHLKNAVP